MSAAAVKELRTARLALIGSARAGRRTLLDMLLSAKGYEIAVCENGPSVLEFLKENQPDIAIFDHDLPGMDGREICSRMRFITRLAETPIAIVTPPVEEMGGVAEFEGFSDTTTADIVEAEPLGKKSLVDRLEGVIRDQKGAANAGKMTIAIPTLVPPLPDIDTSEPAAVRRDLDVFVDDDVDIEVDVARAIYSTDESHDQPDADQQEEPSPVVAAATARMGTAAAAPVAAAAAVEAAATTAAEAPAEPVSAQAEHDEELFLKDSSQEETAAHPENAVEEFDFFTDSDESTGDREDEGLAGRGDVEWPDTSTDVEAAAADAGTNQLNVPIEVESDSAAPEPEEAVEAAPADYRVSGEADELAAENVNPSAQDEAVSDETPVPESEAEDATLLSSYEEPIADEDPVLETDMKNESADKRVYPASRADMPASPPAGDPGAASDEDISATIEAAIEAVNRAAMEEAQYRAAQAEATEEAAEPEAETVPAQSVDSVQEVAEATVNEAADMQRSVDVVGETGKSVPAEVEAVAAAAQEPTVAESTVQTGNNYVDGSDENQIDLTTARTDDTEEGVSAVLNEERSNMQALIDEQAERIENLQQRNVVLRQELEQRRADDALRHEERSNLQALIKEQTEAITNLQQRNVQLRQKLDQYKAEEAKRASERSFLQSHTSEQAETIAKLQQLNTLLRQELEQRKADEAPLRDFLQRLLDRDEKSAYQEAVRNEIISLGRDNS